MKSELLHKKQFPVTRYRLVAKPQEPVDILARAQIYAFKDIDETYDPFSIGWVLPWAPLSTTLMEPSFIADQYLVLSMRIDERKVPASALAKAVAKWEAKEMAEKQVPKLSRGRRQEIKEAVTLMLLKKVSPTAAIYDMVWDTTNGEVWLLSSSSTVKALFEDLFKECFKGYVLEEVIHHTMAQDILGEKLSKITDPVPANMDLLDRIVTYREKLSTQFLEWLWLGISEGSLGDADLVPLLRLESSDGKESVVCKGGEELAEARKAWYLGKHLTQLGFTDLEADYTLILKGLDLTIQNMKLPKPEPIDTDGDDALAATVLLKIDQIRTGIGVLTGVYSNYLEMYLVDPEGFVVDLNAALANWHAATEDLA